MRERSPVENMTPQEFFALCSAPIQRFIESIRQEKTAGTRPLPSASLIDKSQLLTRSVRCAILDRVAELVDENVVGRSEMCFQFADLLCRALVHLGLPGRPALGVAKYYINDREVFHWDHAWVRIGPEVIDGNVDSTKENPAVPSIVDVAPYWGPINETPRDRLLRQNRALSLPPDGDVSDTWWPELKEWLDQRIAPESA